MKIGQYCQRQRCKHVELKQFLAGFFRRAGLSAIAGLSCLIIIVINNNNNNGICIAPYGRHWIIVITKKVEIKLGEKTFNKNA